MNQYRPKEGTLADLVIQEVKRIAFRWPGLRELSRPRYSYNIEPAQLAWLCKAIEDTRTLRGSENTTPGCVVEVGVARGMTSVFLLEHMRQIGDRRPYICLDTFSGFTSGDIKHEVMFRGKMSSHFRGFQYNQKNIFENNLRKCGFENVIVYECDAGKFDWQRIPLIDVMLLDVDLYLPTKAVLANSFDHWSKWAHVMLDDVCPGGDYDGAMEAYRDFCEAKGFPELKIGNKGGIFVMNS
jgi:macrocin-O-methyltransferase TylF-like protien